MTNLDLINLFVDLLIKPMIILFVVLAIVNASRVRPAAFNHGILAAGFLGSGLSILISLFLPFIPFNMLPDSLGLVSRIEDYWIDANVASLLSGCISIYLVISVGVFLKNCHSVIELIHITRCSMKVNDPAVTKMIESQCARIGLKRKVVVFASPDISTPAIWGCFRVRLILPADYLDWDAGRMERILLHEFAHAVRYDWLVKVLINFFISFVWILFPIYRLRKELLWYAEIAADDFVMRVTQQRTEYAADLMELSSNSVLKKHLLITLIHKSGLFERIESILAPDRDRTPAGFKQKFNIVFLAILFVLPFSMIKLDLYQPEDIYLPLGNFGAPLDAITAKDKTESFQFTSEYYYKPVLLNSERHPESSGFPMGQESEFTISTVSLSQIDTSLKTDLVEPSVTIVDAHGAIPHNFVTPIYPRRALVNNIEGKVVAAFDVNEMGNVLNVRILHAVPQKIFNQSVKKALRQSQFIPLTLDGQKIGLENLTEEFHFKLIPGATN